MKKFKTSQSGFTAVELLLTLFIGAAFILAGYQLYVAIINDSASVRNRATANNIASEFAKRKAATISACPGSTTATTETSPSNSGLQSITITSVVSAAYPCGTASDVVRVEIRVQYGPTSDRQEVKNAIFTAL